MNDKGFRIKKVIGVDEFDAWQETLCDIKNSPCSKCGGTKRHVDYNTHDGVYCTFDTVCDDCGYVILSQMD